MKKSKYIKKFLKKNIKDAKKMIKNRYSDVKDLKDLPNDCYGHEIDGFICENKDYKIDAMTSHYHVIGFSECLKSLSKQIMILNSMSKKEFKKFLKEQEEIRKHNKKEKKRIMKIIKSKK